MKYRPEIDGLRALAVIPVILFHAGFELFSGGFVGVDVFFVISGYLITTILIEDIENKRFSIANFYERRARRILPALFFVMVVCIPFAWMWMLPSQMKDFSQSLVAVSLFASNILFLRESGYFDAAAEEKPLLHTWSLAVEEQYYVLFPIFLILAWRFGKNRVFWMIVVMAAISLLLSEWGWRNKATANFYLAPTRAWELFAGSIAAFIVQKQGVQKNNPLALIGLAAIIFSIFFYDETTPFPSLYALAPVLGVVLLVLYAEKDTIAAKLLSAKGFVGIGLISYSVYLWHQPLLAFARIRTLEQPSNVLMLVLSLMSVLLAYLSWRYIEKPFRDRTHINRNSIFVFSFSGLILFSIFGFIGHKYEGFKDRFQQIVNGYQTNLQYMREIDERYVRCEPEVIAMTRPEYKGILHCSQSRTGEADWIILGDSHAEHLFPGLANSTEKNVVFYVGDQPYINKEKFSNVYSYISTLKSQKIVFVTMRYVTRIDDKDTFESSFRELSNYLTDLGHLVILVGDVPMFNTQPERCIYGSSEQIDKYCSISNSAWTTQKNQYENYLISLSNELPNVFYIGIGSEFCDENRCSMIDSSNSILFRDTSHLNIIGSNIVGRMLASFVSTIGDDVERQSSD